MEILILIPLSLLGMLVYAVIAVTSLRGRVRRLDEDLDRLRTDLEILRSSPRTEPRAAEAARSTVGEMLRRKQEQPAVPPVALQPVAPVSSAPPLPIPPVVVASVKVFASSVKFTRDDGVITTTAGVAATAFTVMEAALIVS